MSANNVYFKKFNHSGFEFIVYHKIYFFHGMPTRRFIAICDELNYECSFDGSNIEQVLNSAKKYIDDYNKFYISEMEYIKNLGFELKSFNPESLLK